MPSPESYSIRSKLHKEVAPNAAPLSEQRKAWIDYASTQLLHKDVAAREENIAGVPCLWLANKFSRSPVIIIYLHGGGLVDGAIITHREFVSRLVGITGHRALMVEYRLCPEHKFPAALEDVLSVYSALLSMHGIEAKNVVLGADSSGGGLAVSAMSRGYREGRAMPACAFTLSGTFDLTLSSESMTSRDAIDPCLSYAALQGWLRYFEGVDLSAEEISPLQGELRGLPPLLLLVGDHEVWRDDSIRMADKVRGGGGEADLRIWEGMWHVWPMYADLPEASEAIEEIGKFINQHRANARHEISAKQNDMG